jgi:hypothetical protein
MGVRGLKDLLAGLLYIAIGGAALFFARSYSFGSTFRMGPGYYPVVCGGLLVLLGTILVLRSFIVGDTPPDRIRFGPLLLVLGATALFALCIERFGLAVSTGLVVIVSYLANERPRVVEALLLALVLVAVAVGVFAYGLQLPFKVWPEWT